jgi:hypothetical protein
MKALVLVLLAASLGAQEFGGAPPWGPEKPISFKGEVKHGESYDAPAGVGIWVRLAPTNGGDWTIEIAGAAHYPRCVLGPMHGPSKLDLMAWHFQGNPNSPGSVGDMRWIEFTQIPEECPVTSISGTMSRGDARSRLPK